MKITKHEKHLQMFERQFLDDTKLNIQITESNLIQNNKKPEQRHEYIMGSKPLNSAQQQMIEEKIVGRNMQKREQVLRSAGGRRFKLSIKFYALEVFSAYAITIGLMYLNKVVYFPFFEAIIVLIISCASQPIDITNWFILLGIPISIANYNLGVWILTYPLIVVCYFSRFIFTNRQIKALLWILSSLLQFLFGFLLIPWIGNSLPNHNKFILYYIYPWLLFIVKLIVGLINVVIGDTNVFLLQVSLFLPGLSYGMILSLKISNIEYWYLLVILTLEIINSRYQFGLQIFKKILKMKQNSIMEAHSSGYVALHQVHIIIYIYAVCVLNLSTPKFTYNPSSYIQNLYVPFVAWAFCLAYEVISIVRLRNCEKYVILGYSSYSYFSIIIRIIALSLGLWFFFLGLGIPSLIFSY